MEPETLHVDPLAGVIKVLVVEDEVQIAELYSMVLGKAGMKVQTAKDAASAMQILATEKFDIAFIDIMMPQTNGIDLLKDIRLKKINPGMAVVFLTNIDQDAIIQEGFSLGIQGYLIKSQLAPQQLVDIVKNNVKPGEANISLQVTPKGVTKDKSNFMDKLLSPFTKK